MDHYCTNFCTMCDVLATTCSDALFLTTKTYIKKSQPKTGRLVGVQGSRLPELQDPLQQHQILHQHRYQEVPSHPLLCQGHGQGKFSTKSETILGQNFIFLRRSLISLRMWSPRVPCPGRISPRRVPLTRPTTSRSCTSSQCLQLGQFTPYNILISVVRLQQIFTCFEQHAHLKFSSKEQNQAKHD